MTIKAVSYYYYVFSEHGCSGFKFHKTGKAALETIIEDSKYLFQNPVHWKKKNISIRRRSPVTIGFPHRKLIARFLDDEEIRLVEKYGNDVWWDNGNQRFVVPEEDGE